MLVGLGCGGDKKCGCNKRVEEGLAGILGDLGDTCGGVPNAANYGTSYAQPGDGAIIRLPLTADQNAAYHADLAVYEQCLGAEQGTPSCPFGSQYVGAFAGGNWLGQCIAIATGQPSTPVAVQVGQFNDVAPVYQPTNPTPVTPVYVTPVVAPVPVVTPVPTPSGTNPTTPTTQTQTQVNATTNGTGTSLIPNTTLPPVVAGIDTSSYLLWGGIGLLAFALLKG